MRFLAISIVTTLAVASYRADPPDSITEVISPDTFRLSELLDAALIRPSFSQCRADVLTGGFITLENGTNVLVDNYTVNIPYVFIHCPNDSIPTQNDSLVLRNLALALDAPSVENDMTTMLSKDSFENSILMITFTMCAVCIGTWMVYLVWILLPSKTSFSKTILVPLYILFSAIYSTAMLAKGVDQILEEQYRLNIQDAAEYQNHIINGVANRVGVLIVNTLLCLNWTALVYYMFHDKKRIRVNWLPFTVANRNRLIVITGLTLTAINTGNFGGLLWSPNRSLWISFRVFEFLIYTIFCGSTAFYIWRDFRFILAPQRRTSTNKVPIRAIIRLIWEDYHETIPLLIYNIALFVLLYFTAIYFTIEFSPVHKWQFEVISFIKLIVTVSVWGLINVLERRELIVSKQTVLGRKIYNDDEYFFDPKLSPQYRTVDINESGVISKTTTGENQQSNFDNGVKNRSWIYSHLHFPTKMRRSQLERTKDIRDRSRSKRQRFLDALVGKDFECDNVRAHPAGQEEAYGNTSSGSSLVGVNDGSESSVVRIDENTSEDECATVETTLARNYIYDRLD